MSNLLGDENISTPSQNNQNQQVTPLISSSVPYPPPANHEIQRLKGTNWATWKWQLNNVLDAKGLTDVLVSSPEQIPLGHPREVATRQILSSSMDQSLISKVIHCASAQQIWNCLRGIYENRTSFALTDLIGSMNSYKMNNLDDVESGVSTIQSMACQIKALGGYVYDATIESAILRALPKSFGSFITSWTFLDTEKRTLENLHAHLMRTVCVLKAHDTSDRKDKALAAQRFGRAKDQTNPNSSPIHRESSKESSKVPRKSGGFCRYCKKPGHVIQDCRKRARKHQSDGTPESSDKKKPNDDDKPSDPDTSKTEDNKSAARVSYGYVATTGAENSCLKVDADPTLISTKWIADSGASFHMTAHREWIADYSELLTKFNVRLGDNRELQVEGKGFIETTNGILEPVYYLPGISENLFSVASCAREYKIFAYSTDEHIIFLKDNQELFRGHLNQYGIYELNFNVRLANCSVLLAASLKDWHHRLAHISPQVIKFMAKHNIVNGMVITDANIESCEPCAVSKQQRSRHPSKSSPRSSLPGQVLHFDTVGPMPVKSLGESKYYVLCKDSYSSYRFVFFINNKSDIPSGIKKIIHQAKLDTGNDVLKIVSDQGSEFINSELSSFLNDRGIIHSTSAVYTPEQNGMIERDIRTVGEASRTLRLHAKLPKEFWAEAVNTAVFTLNRVINSRNKEKTPYELWFTKKPRFDNLHRFGEIAIVRTPGRTRDKLDPKGEPHIFTGYTDKTNTYRFINPNSHHLIVSCDATFIGTMFHDSNHAKGHTLDADDMVIISGAPLPQFNPLGEGEEDSFHSIDLPSGQNQLSSDKAIASPKLVSQDDTSDLSSFIDQQLDAESGENTVYADEQTVHLPTHDSAINQDFEDPAIMPQEQPDQDRIRSLRPRHNKPNYNNWRLNMSTADSVFDPTSYKESMSRPDSDKWLAAMKEELKSLKECGVWSLVNKPTGKNIVSNRWVYRIKREPCGNIERYRARLVARGFSQIPGVDYNQTYAPTANIGTIRLLFAHAAVEKLITAQFDICTAFLYGDLDEEVYMQQPEGFTADANKVWRLHKSLYGLKQAPRQWSRKFTDFLIQLGLTQSRGDRCVFFKLDPLVIIIIYVDDGLIFARDRPTVDHILEQLEKRFRMRVMQLNTFLGFQVERPSVDRILLHQKTYINKVIRQYGMETLKPQRSPISPGNEPSDESLLDDSEPYRELVGSLLYAATNTRLDISFPVGKAGRAVAAPQRKHWQLAQRIVRYLIGEPGLALCYRSDRNEGLVTYCDADFCGDDKTARSTTGFVILYGGAPIHWRSVLQDTVATSSTEAELNSLDTAVKELIWLHNLALELGIHKPKSPLTVYCDNTSSIKIATDERSSQRTKFLRAKFGGLQDLTLSQTINIIYVKSSLQLADMLTKPLPINSFIAARNKMLVSLRSKAMLVVMLACSNSLVNNYQFDTVKPVIYQETDKIIDVGVTQYQIDYTPTNPCDVLKAYLPQEPQDFSQMPLPPMVHVTQQGNHAIQPPSSTSIHIDRMVDTRYVQTFIDECETVRSSTWAIRINDLLARSPHLQHHRAKRSIPDAIFGGVVSNLIGTIYEDIAPWSDHNQIKELRHHQEDIDNRVKLFVRTFNASIAVEQGILTMVKQNARSIREQNRQLSFFKEFSQKLTWLSSFIQTRILFVSADLRTVNDEMSHHRVATHELADLFNITALRSIEPMDTEFISVEKLTENTLRFRFNVRKSSPDTHVYKVFAFRFWDNLTGTPEMSDYQGASYVIYNSKVNCIKGAEDLTERVVFDDCSTPNLVGSNVNQWRKHATKDIYTSDLTAHKRSAKANYIYCFPNNITIWNATYRCPTSPFKLTPDIPYSAGNLSHSPNQQRITIKFKENQFIDNVSLKHFDQDSLATSDAQFFDKIQEQSEIIDKLHKEIDYSVSVTKHGVAWWLTIIGFIIITAILLALVIVNIFLSNKLRQQNAQVASDVSQIKNYEPVTCVSCCKQARPTTSTIKIKRADSPVPLLPTGKFSSFLAEKSKDSEVEEAMTIKELVAAQRHLQETASIKTTTRL